MTPPRPGLVVFDVAGTTVLDNDIVLDAMGDALAAGGFRAGRDAIKAVMGLPKRTAIGTLVRLDSSHGAGDDRLVERLHDLFLTRLRERYESHPAVREASGAREVFAALRAHGIKVALDTGFDRPTLEILLRRLGWAEPDVIDASVASDEVSDGRPGAGLIRRAMHLTGVVDSRDVVKVGDTPADMKSGYAAGCGMVVGVAYGTHTREELERHHPSAVIDDLRELLPMIAGQ